MIDMATNDIVLDNFESEAKVPIDVTKPFIKVIFCLYINVTDIFDLNILLNRHIRLKHFITQTYSIETFMERSNEIDNI